MTKDVIEIATPNLAEAAYKMQELIQQGYTITGNSLQLIGWLYVVEMAAPQTQEKPKAKKAKETVE